MRRPAVATYIASTLVAASSVSAQVCVGPNLWDENFEGMTPGGLIIFEQGCFPICSNGFSWQAWDFAAGNGQSEASDLFGNPNVSGEISGRDGMGNTTDDLLHTFNDLDFSSGGQYLLGADLFVPNDMTGDSGFILLNKYIGGDPDKNWSTQIRIDGDDDIVESEFDSVSVPLQRGAWRRIEVFIDLDANTQAIKYDGETLITKSWTEGLSGGGLLDIQALDLFGNVAPDQSTPVYYDNMSLCPAMPAGACCFRTDPCIDSITQADCQALQGDAVYQGDNTFCDGSCPFYGPNGWEINDLLTSAPPFNWDGDTCNDFPGIPFNEDCEFFPEDCSECDLDFASQDQIWSFEIPWTGTWTVTTCGLADFDTVLFTSFIEGCDDTGPFDDDCSDIIQGEDDSHVEVSVNDIAPPGGGHGDLYVTLEGFDGDCGAYTLRVGAPCPPLNLGPDEELLGPCADEDPDTENIGCNADPNDPLSIATFTNIVCGDTFSGTVGSFVFQGDSRRDLDWFRLEIDTAVTLTLDAVGNYPEVVLFLVELNDNPGSGEDECTGFGVLASDITPTCVEADGSRAAAQVSFPVEPGLYSPIVSTGFVDPAIPFELGGVPCGSPYELTVSCTTCFGDVDGNNIVSFGDILLIMQNWQCTGSNCPGDTNGDGIVNTVDILNVLIAWGPCP